MEKTQRIIVGTTGEHYVAAYLSGMGLIVSLTRGGIQSIDLLVASPSGGRPVSVQVKTGAHPTTHVVYAHKPKDNYWTWHTGPKALDLSDETYWYAFVFTDGWPKSGRVPEVFFVPSKVVAKRIRKEQRKERTRLYFWMDDAKAEEYRGIAGYGKLLTALAT